MKLLGKGISHDNKYIVFKYQCDNGVDTFFRRYLIREENKIFLGYGTHIRTPDHTTTIKGVTYAIFFADGKNIKFIRDNDREYDGLCYIVK